jgi:hypothetical protein
LMWSVFMLALESNHHLLLLAAGRCSIYVIISDCAPIDVFSMITGSSNWWTE